MLVPRIVIKHKQYPSGLQLALPLKYIIGTFDRIEGDTGTQIPAGSRGIAEQEHLNIFIDRQRIAVPVVFGSDGEVVQIDGNGIVAAIVDRPVVVDFRCKSERLIGQSAIFSDRLAVLCRSQCRIAPCGVVQHKAQRSGHKISGPCKQIRIFSGA